jgi:hypothetical protein
MRKLLVWAARIAGVLGVAVIAIAFAGRISGSYWIAGLQIGTVLQAGMAAALVACVAYLAALVESRA